MRRAICSIIVLLLVVSRSHADPVKLQRPVRVELQLKSESKKSPVEVLQYDDDELVVRSKVSGEARHRWIDLNPSNAFIIRRKLAEPRKANDYLKLGKFGWDIGATTEATVALTTAAKMDKTLRPEVDLVLNSEPGRLLKPAPEPTTEPTDEPATTQPSDKPTTPSPTGELPPSVQPTRKLDANKVVKYQQATPQQHAAAIDGARKLAGKVAEKMNLTFTEFQTDHFICFHNWDPREEKFLKDNLEGAYATVSRQFEIPVKENVFVGKLPVFMFAKHDDFMDFASDIDHFPVPKTVAGYYMTMVSGEGEQSGGHMAMWKPDITGNNVPDAERRWAYTLVHEFTHAFVARYRTNQRIPRWLNEGVAEVIADGRFPRAGARDFARRMALMNADVKTVFDDDTMPGGEMYPVMMTMVQTLITHDRKAFLRYFDDIKAGVDPEEALQKHYHSDYDGLVNAWKKFLQTSSGGGGKK